MAKARIIRIPIKITGYAVVYDEDPETVEQSIEHCTPMIAGNSMLVTDVQITGETVVSCCFEPKVRGGKCENCGRWVEDT